jgi:predicted Rdx family selenoprotein
MLALGEMAGEAGAKTMDYNPKAKSELWVSEHPEGSVMLDSDTGRVFVCNETGALIWKRLSEGLSIDAIAAEIAQTFNVEPEQASRDAQRFVAELQRQGLLVGGPDDQV